MMKDHILKSVKDSITVKEKFFSQNVDQILEIANLISEAFNQDKKLLLFGNGGSATDASHIAAEFVNRFKMERPGLPALALNTDMAVITSIANDYDFADVFSRQIKSLGRSGDIVLGISTSGGSKNVLNAMDVANKKNLITIAFTGLKGTQFASMARYSFIVPSADTPRIQETHIVLGHILCQIVEELLFRMPAKAASRAT